MDKCPTCFRAFRKKSVRKRNARPTPQEVTEYAKTIGFICDGEKFVSFYESKGWMIGKSPMKSWKAAVRTWKGMATPDKLIALNLTPEERIKKAEAKQKELETLREREWLKREGK